MSAKSERGHNRNGTHKRSCSSGAGAGVGIWTLTSPLLLDQSQTGFAARLGVGLDLYLSKNLALNVEGAGVLNTNTFNFAAGGSGQTLSGLYYFSVSAGLLYHF